MTGRHHILKTHQHIVNHTEAVNRGSLSWTCIRETTALYLFLTSTSSHYFPDNLYHVILPDCQNNPLSPSSKTNKQQSSKDWWRYVSVFCCWMYICTAALLAWGCLGSGDRGQWVSSVTAVIQYVWPAIHSSSTLTKLMLWWTFTGLLPYTANKPRRASLIGKLCTLSKHHRHVDKPQVFINV